MLYPVESETRELKDLSGLWEFRADKAGEGFSRKWFAAPLAGTMPMPVPASYNDITQDIALRDHLGDVWYERSFFVPREWGDRRIVLRVGSATHSATVWINGHKAVSHVGGFLPFEAEVSRWMTPGQANRVTIAVSNILTYKSIPPGYLMTPRDEWHPKGYRTLSFTFDFFNYSGVHRPVLLYTTPKTYIADVTAVTDIRGKDGSVACHVVPSKAGTRVRVRLLDADGREAASADGPKTRLVIHKARLWEPGRAYLYMLVAELLDESGRTVTDAYRLPVGIRTVKVSRTHFLINGKPFYFKGVNKHEDSDIRGKGHDHAVNVKDFNLMKWMGANAFRTSHYPYSDEIMNLADREGFVIVDEAPAVGLHIVGGIPDKWRCFNKAMLKTHLQVMRELVRRDKNHPCVVMWSVANEASTEDKQAGPYFKTVIDATRKLDPTRPVTLVDSALWHKCRAARYADILCVNRYFSWYTDSGRLDLIEHQLERELRHWHDRFKKPVIVSEFGADAVAGLHQHPPVMFTEEYQVELLRRFQKVFDKLDFVVGEWVWAFSDFATKQTIHRVGGNKKGVFTRQRQPKMAAYWLRKRWTGAGDELLP